jgi:hypothetical protein
VKNAWKYLTANDELIKFERKVSPTQESRQKLVVVTKRMNRPFFKVFFSTVRIFYSKLLYKKLSLHKGGTHKIITNWLFSQKALHLSVPPPKKGSIFYSSSRKGRKSWLPCARYLTIWPEWTRIKRRRAGDNSRLPLLDRKIKTRKRNRYKTGDERARQQIMSPKNICILNHATRGKHANVEGCVL